MKSRFELNKAGLFKSIFRAINQQRQKVDDLLTEIYASPARLSPMAEELNNMQHSAQQKSMMQEQLGISLNKAFTQIHEATMGLHDSFGQISLEISRESSQYLENTIESISGLSNRLISTSNQQQQVANRAQGEISSMVKLNQEVKERSIAQELSAQDLKKLADRLKSFVDTFEFNDVLWDEGIREKKIKTAKMQSDKDIELF
jgi:methyl-accepting chemotaxis protein